MNNDPCETGTDRGTLRERLMSHLVRTAPEHSAICEFDCDKTECTNEEWTHCQRRLDSLRLPDPPPG
jgi:hypothetical protein